MPLGAARLTFLARSVLTAAAEVIRKKASIQAVGNAQVDTAQRKFGGASAYFDGSGDGLQIKHSNIVFGTDDFTIEFWWRPTSRPGNYPPILTNFNDSYSANEWGIFDRHANASTKFGVDIYNVWNGGQSLTSTTSVSNGVWYHIAVVRSGTTFTLYINGTSQDTATSSASMDGGVNKDIFAAQVNGNYGNGHLDELRISNVARYTTNFSVATTPFVNDENTLLLLHMDGTDAITYFEDDNGVRASLPVSYQGTAAVSTAQSKFGGSSILVGSTGANANGFYVWNQNLFGTTSQTYPIANWGANSGFTCELWVRYTSLTEIDDSGPATIGIMERTDYSICWGFGSDRNGALVFAYTNGSGTFVEIKSSNSQIAINTWYHIAWVKNGSSIKTYINGVEKASATYSTHNSQARDLTIGSHYRVGSRSYVDEVRISNTARYTTGFTPPTAPFVNDENTLFLLHCDGTNGATLITDDSGIRARASVIVQGNCQIDNAQSKFGGTSMLTDGNLDALQCRSFNLTGDWTFEGWYRINSAVYEVPLFRIHNSSNTFQANYGILNSKIYTYQGGTTSGTTTLSTGVWYHIAFVRSGTTVSLYLNGTREATRSYSSPPNDAYLYLSGTADASNYSLNGWSDEVRVSSTARYTGTTFTVPTEPFQNDTDTMLLLHMDGTDASTTFIDDNGVSPDWEY